MKYALALSYRANHQLDKANEVYCGVMKTADTIDSCLGAIYAKNMELLEANINQEIDYNCVAVDLYSHFRGLDIPKKNPYYIDLSPYYDPHEGWKLDYVPHVVSLLKKVRFFNRFDEDTLK